MKQELYRSYLKMYADIEVDPQYTIHLSDDHMGAMLWWAGARPGETFYPDLEELVDYIIDQTRGS